MATDPDPDTARERMLAGLPYIADDPELARAAARARALLRRFNADGPDARTVLAELLGGLGDHADVRPPLRCDYGTYLTIGPSTFVNFGLIALDCAPIAIGAHVQVGPNVQLLTPTHPLDPERRRAGWEAAEPITIADNAWLGGGVIVLPGVSVGRDAVVGAGAVVTRDVPPGAVVVGNPARVIRSVG